MFCCDTSIVEIEDARVVEPEIDALRAADAAHEQARGDEQHERHRHLPDDEHAPKTLTPAAVRHAASAFTKHLVEIRARRADRGQQADDEPCPESDRRDVGEHAPIERVGRT